VPRWTAQYYAFTLREPFIVGLPIGLAFAWRYRRRESILPLAVVVAMTAVFAIGPIFGLPLIGRYLRTPSVFLALFYGAAVFGWLLLKRGTRERRIWAALGVVAALASIAWLPWHLDKLDGISTRAEREGILYGDLRKAGEAPEVQASLDRCAPMTAGDHRPIPYVRWWLDGDPGTVGTVENGHDPLGRLVLLPRRSFVPTWFYKENFPRVQVPASYRVLYENRSWQVLAAPGC
jgi:hypothetical protein